MKDIGADHLYHAIRHGIRHGDLDVVPWPTLLVFKLGLIGKIKSAET